MLKFTRNFCSSCKAVSWSGVNSICRVKTNLVTMKYELVVLIIMFVKQSYQYDCKTPKGDDGNCINVFTCKPILDFLESRELTQEIRNEFLKYQCDRRSNDIKVCCPDKLDRKPDFTKHKNFHLLPEDCGPYKDPDRILLRFRPEPFEYPWAALLYYPSRKGLVIKCGGSLINKRYVLTAANCVVAPHNVVSVRIGEYDLNTPEDCREIHGKDICEKAQNIAVEKVIIHPGYDYKVGSNDIALLRLDSDVVTSKVSAYPICLPIQGHTTIRRGTVIGWGTTENGTTSNVPLLVALPLINNSVCIDIYKSIPEVTISSKQFCAGGLYADTCEGDGGVALFGIDSYTPNSPAYIQYGVLSFGTTNCGNGIPGVYTKVSEYVDWILDNLVE